VELDDSADGFHRQRRNLVAGCITLLFIDIAGLTLSPEGTVLGFSFSIKNPELMPWFLRVAVVYWLVRFYQYHRTKIPTGFVEFAQKGYWDLLKEEAIAAIREVAPEVLPQPPNVLDANERNELVAFNFNITKRRIWEITAECDPTWQVWKGEEIVQQHHSHLTGVFFRGFRLFKIRMRGYWSAVANTPLFTDYGLPYGVFFLAAIVDVYMLVNGHHVECLAGC